MEIQKKDFKNLSVKAVRRIPYEMLLSVHADRSLRLTGKFFDDKMMRFIFLVTACYSFS